MEFSARQIAELVSGEISGNPDVTVHSFAKIEEGKKGTLSFVGNPKYLPYLYQTQASIVIISKCFELHRPVSPDVTLIRVDDAYQSFTYLLQLYERYSQSLTGREEPHYIGNNVTIGSNPYIGAFVYIGSHARIGDDVKIYPHVYIGENVVIGNHTILYPGVKIYKNCIIGSRCIIHAGAVIGSDGFGFIPDARQKRDKVPQIGNVVIEDEVEIGANTTIDRATIGSTYIRRGVKLDNLIQIAHNVEIGENTVIAAQTGIAGSTKIGKNCMIGGQVGIVGHLTIADEVKIAAQSGIGNSIHEKGLIVQGSPAFEINQYKRSYVLFKKLPSLASDVEAIKNKKNENIS